MSDRIKVATLSPFLHIGGDENRLLAYLGARDRDTFEHVVVSGSKATTSMDALWGPMRRRFESLDVELVDLSLPYNFELSQTLSRRALEVEKAKRFASFVRGAARLFRDRQIDVVDARGDTGSVVGIIAGRLAGVRAVVATNYFPQVNQVGSRSPAWLLNRAIYAMADAIVCDSQTCLDAMREWMILPPPGHCIPNGIDPPRTERSAADVAADLNIAPNSVIVAQIARLQPYKGQLALLEAASTVVQQFPNTVFVICGYPSFNQEGLDYQKRLHQIVAERRLEQNVRLISYPGSVGDIWPLVHIHVHPTLLDSSPIALLEGMSFGKAAITTRIGGIHELVLDGETGIVLPPDDTEALTTAMLRLLGNPAEVERLGRNAYQRYKAHYTPNIMARRSEDVFKHVFNTPRLRRARRPGLA